MSAADIWRSGAGQSVSIDFVAIRWGGGADHGKWHVYPSRFWTAHDAQFLNFSSQCVIDDFGNLVRVQ